MGTAFRYLADHTLTEDDSADVCPRCQQHVEAFTTSGFLDANREDEFFHLCADCLRSIPLRQLEPRDGERTAQNIVNQHFPKGTLSGAARFSKAVEICDEFRRTPRIPMFLQGEDWPSCCGEFTQYVGTEPAGGLSYDDYQCWDDPASFVAQFKLEDYYPLDKIQVLKSMGLFHCIHCDNRYWVFQYSGLFWPGPLKDCQA